MSRPNPTVLFGFFVAVIVAMCGVSILKGGLYLGKHEGDTLHLLQIVLRMADGQWPHLDFMTPIGVLAFAPIALFVKLGYGAGMAIILAQTLVAVILLPAIWWAAYSRMRGMLPYLFGLFVIVLITALVHGEAQRSVSISMHYNRWAWALAFVAIVLSFIPPFGKQHPGVDGVMIGLALAALLLMKITYLAAFSLPVLLALVLHRAFRTILIALITGIIVLLVVTSMAGPAFWPRYISDLLLVTLGGVRPEPGEPFVAILGAPAYIGASLILVFGVIMLRQARESIGGLLLLVLAPGFFFVTYQNFGNDPQWLLLLGVLLIASMPELEIKNGLGWDMRNALKVTAGIALAFAAPSFFNLAYSPFRHFGIDTDKYTPILIGTETHTDLQVSKLRGYQVDARIAFDGPGSGLEAYADISERDEVTFLNGEALPDCTVELGLPAWFETIATDLDNAGLAEGKRIFAADLFSSQWLFGPLLPLVNGAPWYYGGLPGFDSADYVLVPLCPIVRDIRGKIINTIDERGYTLTEIRRTPLYILTVASKP